MACRKMSHMVTDGNVSAHTTSCRTRHDAEFPRREPWSCQLREAVAAQVELAVQQTHPERVTEHRCCKAGTLYWANPHRIPPAVSRPPLTHEPMLDYDPAPENDCCQYLRRIQGCRGMKPLHLLSPAVTDPGAPQLCTFPWLVPQSLGGEESLNIPTPAAHKPYL